MTMKFRFGMFIVAKGSSAVFALAMLAQLTIGGCVGVGPGGADDDHPLGGRDPTSANAQANDPLSTHATLEYSYVYVKRAARELKEYSAGSRGGALSLMSGTRFNLLDAFLSGERERFITGPHDKWKYLLLCELSSDSNWDTHANGEYFIDQFFPRARSFIKSPEGRAANVIQHLEWWEANQDRLAWDVEKARFRLVED